MLIIDVFIIQITVSVFYRLNTILDSTKVLVLDDGEIDEYDKPETLLKDKQSSFYSFASKANIV